MCVYGFVQNRTNRTGREKEWKIQPSRITWISCESNTARDFKHPRSNNKKNTDRLLLDRSSFAHLPMRGMKWISLSDEQFSRIFIDYTLTASLSPTPSSSLLWQADQNIVCFLCSFCSLNTRHDEQLISSNSFLLCLFLCCLNMWQTMIRFRFWELMTTGVHALPNIVLVVAVVLVVAWLIDEFEIWILFAVLCFQLCIIFILRHHIVD